MIEYVLRQWSTSRSDADPAYCAERERLEKAGWKVLVRRAFRNLGLPQPGGICVMTRERAPTPTPRNWTRCTKCGYVDRPVMRTEEEMLQHLYPPELKRKRWRDPPADTVETVGKAECLGRLWSEKELRYMRDDGLSGIIDKRIERATEPLMSTIRAGMPVTPGETFTLYGDEGVHEMVQRLRIEVLQKAIDEVVSGARLRQGDPCRPYEDGRVPTHDAVMRLLGPLATKGEPETRAETDARRVPTEPVYEYVAVIGGPDEDKTLDPLKARGWSQTLCARLDGGGHIHLMRRDAEL